MKNPTLQLRLEDQLARLVAMPTISEDIGICSVAIKGLATELAEMGLHITLGGEKHSWLVATTQKTKHPKVMLVAHLDVVPPSTDDHFEMKATDTKLFGRGVYDMKFALACYLELLHSYGDTKDDYDIGLMITTDEELGGHHGTQEALSDGWSCDIAVLPDGGRDWEIEAKAKGMLIISVAATGKSSHGSRPWEGENAFLKLLPALNEISIKYPSENPLGLTASINVVQSGAAQNQLPERAEAQLDIRAFDPQDTLACKAFLVDLARRHDLEYTELAAAPPVTLQQEHPLVQKFITSVERTTNKPAKLTYSFGSSDARYFNERNIPTVLVTPHGGGSHGADEWIMRDELTLYYELLEHYVASVARVRKTAKTSVVK
ncbi:MAG: M20 family metallopeptidase [Candidatus Saccharimonadales bacterium]